ncbi:MAG: ComEC/Rec2 family competence protein, partial [Duncaniella sp.]|nr:ComEC/Rec2 family competence protein [Duncaniella sp.]
MPPIPPLLPVALALAAGIIVAGVTATVWWVLLPLAAGVAAYALRRVEITLLAATFAVGMMLIYLQQSLLPPAVAAGEETTFSGIVTEQRELDGALELIVRVDSAAGKGCSPFRSVVRVPGFSVPVDERDRLGFTATLRPLESRAVIPDEIDRSRRLRRQSIEAEGMVRPADIHYCIAEPGVFNTLRRARVDIQRLIVSLPLKPSTQYFLIATLTGDRQYLPPEIMRTYASGGVAHILALSGMHVAIIMGCIMVVLMPLRLWRLHTLSRVTVVVLLWGFALLTGMSPSVVRAVIMATVWLAASQMQRRHSPLNALAFAAIVLMAAEPRVIYTVGFQLSFAAVAGVVLFAEPLNPVRSLRSPLRWLGASVAMSVAA